MTHDKFMFRCTLHHEAKENSTVEMLNSSSSHSELLLCHEVADPLSVSLAFESTSGHFASSLHWTLLWRPLVGTVLWIKHHLL